MFFVRPRFRILFVSGVSVTATTCYFLLSHREDFPPLSPSRFTSTTLIKSEDASSNTKVLTLAIPPGSIPPESGAFAPICSVFVKDSDIQVERPYTPLEGIDETGHIKLWVKKYERGEVSRWLHSKKVGDSIEIRGPVRTWSSSWQNGPWDEVILVSGGTGITPFHQLLHSIFKTSASDISFKTRFTLLHGSRSVEDLPPSSLIQSLVTLSQEYPERFQLRLFAESMNDSPESRSLDVQCGRIGKSVLQDVLRLPAHNIPWWRRLFELSAPTLSTPEKRILVLVCGPEGMVNTIAGPYGRNYSQGSVGGILRELGLKSHQVWKL